MSIEEEINKSLLRDAVGRQMFCPNPAGDCGGAVLDMADAVYVSIGPASSACCGKCYDAQVERAGPPPAQMEIIDGRELFGEDTPGEDTPGEDATPGEEEGE